MDVGVDHIVDLEPGFRRDLDVGTRIGNGIDDRADPPAPATKEVRDADGVGVQELAKDHQLVSFDGETAFQLVRRLARGALTHLATGPVRRPWVRDRTSE